MIRRKRQGELSPGAALSLASLGGLVIASYLMLELRQSTAQTGEAAVRVYCAAGVVQPVEQALARLRESLGIHAVVVHSGGSGQLFGQIVMEAETGLDQGADLFVTADDELMIRGQAQGIIGQRFALAVQHPVIAVRKDAPIRPQNMAEMVRKTEFGIAGPHAAIGVVTRSLATREDVLDELLRGCRLETENVMQLAQALLTGSLDAAVVWDATVTQVNRHAGSDSAPLAIATRWTQLPEGQGVISLGVVKRQGAPHTVLAVAQYLAAKDGGLSMLREYGFEVAPSSAP